MSVQSCQSNVSRLQRELAELQRKFSQETSKEATLNKNINQAQRSMSSSSSASTINSKLRQIERYMADLARVQRRKSDLEKRISEKRTQLHRAEQELAREQERERKKVEDVEKRRYQEQLQQQRAITRELQGQKRLAAEIRAVPAEATPIAGQGKEYDAFISHATEDKDEFVRPLVEELAKRGVNVWYDEFTLTVGDSLRRSIDHGLANSRYGVVVLSSSFFQKNWPQYELDGLVTKEMDGRKVILPIWHKVSKDEVKSFSPSLADRVALNSSIMSVSEIAEELADVLRQ